MISNPKGLKNIPAIRQYVAMFLRNICLQVITIHLFGFKVYEFEKIKFFFINIFVQVIILCIFVEIIKKSTTMKNTIFTLIVTLISLAGSSQSLFVYSDTCYFYDYSKNQDIDSILSKGITPFALSSVKTTYEFNVDNNILIVTEGSNSPVTYSIKEVITLFEDETAIHCRVIQNEENIIDVFVFVDFETNDLELRTDFVKNSDVRSGTICPHGKYEFK